MRKLSVLSLWGVACLGILGCGAPSDTSQTETTAGARPGVASQANGPALSGKTVGGVNLKPTTLLSGKLVMLIPDGFVQMDEATLRTKYPSANRPSLVFTNDRGTMNVAINHSQDRVTPSQLTQLHQQLDSSIRQAVPNANWMFSGFQHYGGRKWVQLEFVSPAIDTKIHNLMVASSLEQRMLAVSFNVTDELSGEWLGVGREIISSMRISE